MPHTLKLLLLSLLSYCLDLCDHACDYIRDMYLHVHYTHGASPPLCKSEWMISQLVFHYLILVHKGFYSIPTSLSWFPGNEATTSHACIGQALINYTSINI